MKRFLALFMAIALVAVVFAACNKDPEDPTTTAGSTATGEDTTAANTAGTNDPTATDTTGASDPTATDTTGTSDPTVTDTTGLSNLGENTTTPTTPVTQAEQAPVGNDIAKIVPYYNQAANATKSSPNFRATKHTLQHLKFEKPTALAWFANALLKDLDNKTFDRDETFMNGKGTKNTGYTTTGFLPIKDKTYMSQLTANYVASANCVKDGNNFKVTIKLKDETVNAKSDPPGYSSCMDSVTEDIRNVKEVKISDSAQATYSRGEIVAVVNPQGKLVFVSQFAAARISGDLESGTVSIPLGGKVKNASVNGDFLSEYKFYW